MPADPPAAATTPELNPWVAAADILQAAVAAVAAALVHALEKNPSPPLFRAFVDLYEIASKKAGRAEDGRVEIISEVVAPDLPDETPEQARAGAALPRGPGRTPS
ncbi:unnamed protein product [marine sediment metagenome]|uniref:Uncharacterized protein n=1 Tax=marine sediment metagenome TaxID=412755 RepID=X1KDW5_9ZZZZ